MAPNPSLQGQAQIEAYLRRILRAGTHYVYLGYGPGDLILLREAVDRLYGADPADRFQLIADIDVPEETTYPRLVVFLTPKKRMAERDVAGKLHAEDVLRFVDPEDIRADNPLLAHQCGIRSEQAQALVAWFERILASS